MSDTSERVVSWEWSDGSCGQQEYATPDEARRVVDALSGMPVRVWIGDDVVQQGFIASDERGEP